MTQLGVAGAAVLLGAQPAFAGGPPSTAGSLAGASPVATARTAAAPTVAAQAAARGVSGPERSLVVGTPTLTAAQRASIAAKDAGVARVLAAQRRSTASGARSQAADPLPSHRSIKAVKQKAQSRSYWCGPATLQMLALADGAKISQSTAAKRLKTTRNGTSWYSGSGRYPMERALERYSDGFDYTPQNLPYTPSDADVQTFTDRLMADIAVQRQGIAGNAVEVRNGPHLNGHPNRTIYHWVAVRGYDDDGATTRYADSVAGSSISWAAPVPRYNEIDTDKIVMIFGARGYVW